MEKRTYILTVALAVLVALSLVGNYILFNQFSNKKQTLENIQIQLAERKVELQSTQAEWEALQASLKDAQDENIKLLAYEDRQLTPVDPNKVLPSGSTLGEVKVVVDEFIKSAVNAGYTLDEAKVEADKVAKELGTSLEELNRIQEDTSQPEVQQPTQQEQTKPSTKPADNGNSGGNKPTKWDKDGNGIKDSLEGYGNGDGSGDTISDPDFKLH